jgi:hypothetical protein
VQRGISLDQSKAQTALANQIAQLYAGYQSNLGLAGLNYQNQAAMQNTALNSQQLGWMNSVNAGYPQAGMYAQLAQMYGQGQQGAADRALLMGGGGSGAAGRGRWAGRRAGHDRVHPGRDRRGDRAADPGNVRRRGRGREHARRVRGDHPADPRATTPGMGTRSRAGTSTASTRWGTTCRNDEPTNLDAADYNAYQTGTYDQYANGYDLSDYYGDMG